MRASSGPYIAEDMAIACRGKIICGAPDTAFRAISTDSRDIRSGDLFVPLRGSSFDGHDFVVPALEAGARGSLCDRDANREIPNKLANIVLIQVQDTLRALSDLASTHRSKYAVPLIAVTGSSGKTTVKEMIAAALSRSHRPLVSQGNLNNTIGLPMTVLNLGPNHTAAVVEAGINRNREMDDLVAAASPHVAVITNVGPVHLEGLGTIENVAREKFKLVQGVDSRGAGVIPAENPYLKPLLNECSCRIVTFGIESGEFRAESVALGNDTIGFKMNSPAGKREVNLRMQGRHNVANALAAFAACSEIGVPLDEIAAALNEFQSPALRMEIVTLHGARILIRDCYNANPQSMKAALEALAHRSNPGKLAILADMAELGEYTEALHAEVGGEAARLGIDRIIFVGSFGKAFASGYAAAGGLSERLTLAGDKDEAWKLIYPDLDRFGAILVKGSRVMKMETMADRIMEGK
ncbi:MAG: UDP-N-acetylmuramoyl-tripeptide--D-alanyl-D-alanine ligase [Desulfomonile tiedjei]|uniref:UDP-N-acetylmuramoyl-tripeptide--D-alanyl-D-alanine ligase n=1 Tax=Desulfomonile tiedjei TaxID=2358 RepID=A0A9D6V8F1_9BACT|nr:UDP-N-acetylmuramoyl-tripeptide--D-alanyl-D-alanine ligase [Desulfomonile tiedjei]